MSGKLANTEICDGSLWIFISILICICIYNCNCILFRFSFVFVTYQVWCDFPPLPGSQLTWVAPLSWVWETSLPPVRGFDNKNYAYIFYLSGSENLYALDILKIANMRYNFCINFKDLSITPVARHIFVACQHFHEQNQRMSFYLFCASFHFRSFTLSLFYSFPFFIPNFQFFPHFFFFHQHFFCCNFSSLYFSLSLYNLYHFRFPFFMIHISPAKPNKMCAFIFVVFYIIIDYPQKYCIWCHLLS